MMMTNLGAKRIHIAPVLIALTLFAGCTTVDRGDSAVSGSGSEPMRRGKSQAPKTTDADDPLNELETKTDPSQGAPAANADVAAVAAVAPQDSANDGIVQGAVQSGSVQVTNIGFRGNQNGGTILISTSGPAQYRVRKNSDHNQTVIELVNAKLPDKLKRPYITKDFSSAILSFNAYQGAGSPVVRIVVQMKDSSRLFLQQEGNALIAMPQIARTAGGEGDSGSVKVTTATTISKNTVESSKVLSNDLADFMSGNLKFYGHEVSMEYQNADVREVLNQIADESGLNMIVSDNVKGNISIRLRQVPWDQALVLVLQTKGLGYIRQGSVLRIAPLADLKKEAEDTEAALLSQKTLAPLRTRVVKLSHAKPDELLKMVQTFLTPKRGMANSDTRTNAMVVTDTDEVLARVTELLLRLDRPTPQVLIEGKVIESQENLSSEFGVNWFSASAGISLGFMPSTATPTTTVTVSSGILGDLTARLGLMESVQRVKILSSPRIVTLSGQKAEITTDYQFPTYPSQATASGTGAAAIIATVPVYQTVKVIDLGVTPLVSNDGRIRLDLSILRQFAGPVDTNAQSQSTQSRPIYTRTAHSSMLVKNGQTAVLGGAYNSDETYGDDHLPILGSIPIIGNLFKHKIGSVNKSELMIFLTPTIVE